MKKNSSTLKRKYANLWSKKRSKSSVPSKGQKRLATVVKVTLFTLGCASIGFLVYNRMPSRTLLRNLINKIRNKKTLTADPSNIVTSSSQKPIWNRRRALIALGVAIVLHICAACYDGESSELVPEIHSTCTCRKRWQTNIIYDDCPWAPTLTFVAMVGYSAIHRFCGPAVSGTIWLGTTILAYSLPKK